MAQEGNSIRSRLEKIQEIIKGKRKILIVTHNNPDPDALASALALKYLLHEKWGVGSLIAYGGIIGRAENRAMIRQLRIDIRPLQEVNIKNFSVVALVDSQPGAGNNALPRHLIPDIVIDHHSPIRAKSLRAKYHDIRTDYGSTSTILAEYLMAADLPDIDRRVATAVMYGIKSDTRDLGRATSPQDVTTFLFLYPNILFKILSKIEHPELPRAYYQRLGKAIANARIDKDVIILDLGHADDVDMIAAMADLLLLVEGVKWSLCVGENGGNVFFSLRTKRRRGSADRVAQKMVAGIGMGGGHNMIAGGKAGAVSNLQKTPEEIRDILVSRFLTEIKRKDFKGQSL
jgi:nanoRNase/pAp phosphatase (c-di-AMP/oligoRNAs hydrolase)